MNTIENFRNEAHRLVDWMSDYLKEIEGNPVKSAVRPGEIFDQLPDFPPQEPEPFSNLFEDFTSIILPGMTHWQHPSFHAYFPGNSSLPSVLAEMLTATLGAQCMMWETSPAAAELEEQMMEWLKVFMGLPESWVGVIQDTASTATLASLLTAREKFSGFSINQKGFQGQQFIIYTSEEIHSSIDKAVKIAGFGTDNLRKIPVDKNFAMLPEKLEEAILQDKQAGKQPLAIVAAIGTTSSTACDPIRPIGEIAQRHHLWLHVDAAYAGSATCLPELKWMIDGVEMADSYVFNPHKWLFTNFDCTAYYVKDKKALLNTFSIMPEYLKTTVDTQVNNYRDWGIPLGRRFRALKLWFVLRSFGTEQIQTMLREHLAIAQQFWKRLSEELPVELLAPIPLNLVCFRLKPKGMIEEETEQLNVRVLNRINDSGKAYITHTRLRGTYTIRAVFGNTRVEMRHADQLASLIKLEYERLLAEIS